MSKVGCEIGVTLHLGNPQHNEYVHLTIKVDEIDTELPLDVQLEKTNGVIKALVENVSEKLMEEIKKVKA